MSGHICSMLSLGGLWNVQFSGNSLIQPDYSVKDFKAEV